MIPLPFYVVASTPIEATSDAFTISNDTNFAEFIGATNNLRALAVFATLEDAQQHANGRIKNGIAIPIKTTTRAIEFLCEVKIKCGICHIVIGGSHSTTRRGYSIDEVAESFRSQFEIN